MAAELVDEAIEAYKAGNKSEAVQLLTEALRREPRNETAWLYLGASLDDPEKRRQAFERVLQINPDNERAKVALSRLSSPEATGSSSAGSRPKSTGSSTSSNASSTTGSNAGSTAAAASAAAAENLKRAQEQAQRIAGDAYRKGFPLPIKIPGAPDVITGPYIIETTRTRAMQGVNLYTTRNFEAFEKAAEGATIWDSVFSVGMGAIILALAAFVGHFLGFFLILFGGRANIGSLIVVFMAPLIILLAVGAGFAAAVYATRFFLQRQYSIDAPIAQIGILFALVLLPLLLVQALFEFFAAIFVSFFLFLEIVAVTLMALYIWYLLKDLFGRIYGTDNDRNLYSGAILVGVYLTVSELIRVIFKI